MSKKNNPKFNIATLILSAGQSSRMKEPKQLLTYKNTTLLDHICQHMVDIQASECSRFCVTGYQRKKIEEVLMPYKITPIYNPNFRSGMSSSIVSGIKHLIKQESIDAVLIVLSDQPTIPLSHFQKMIKSYEVANKNIVSTSYDSSYGAPAIFSKSLFPELLKLSQDQGAKKLIKQKAEDTFFIHCSEAVNDIDTLEDYKKLITTDKNSS